MDDMIELQLSKLLYWLLDRKISPSDWKSKSDPIEDRFHELQNTLECNSSEDALIRLMQCPCKTYFTYVRIYDFLKKQYDAHQPVVEQWTTLLNDYKQDGIYFASCASVLDKMAHITIPEMKQKVTRLQKQIQDMDKKKSDTLASAAQYKTKYSNMCRDLGIPGNDIQSELQKVVANVGPLYEDVLSAMQSSDFLSAMEFYTEFVGFIAESPTSVEKTLPNLTHVRQAPSLSKSDVTDPSGDDHEIELIQVETVETLEHSLPLDSNGSSSDENGGDIDWSVLDEDQGGGLDADLDSRAFDYLLADGDIRNGAIDELLELEGFFAQRLVELNDSNNRASIDIYQNASSVVQQQTVSSITSLQAAVRKVNSLLTDPKSAMLILMSCSDAYLKSIANSLEEKLRWGTLLNTKAHDIERDIVQARQSISQVQPQISLYTQETRQLQADLEHAISVRYQGQPVKILGTLNAW